ncbi:MAG: hypothetical protein LAT81_08845 [Oceanicaulis sp.]|nr:hypothetical protein [Oceanicaulis sp.]
MKQQVIQYLKSDRSYNTAIKLLNTIKGVPMALVARANRTPESADFHAQINYSICKAVGIQEREMNSLLAQPLAEKSAPDSEPKVLKVVKTQGEPVDPANPPKEVSQGAALRQEFPFLNDKNCPQEFKILVADKLSAYYRFKEAHAELENLTDEALAEKVEETVEAFIENEIIWRELNHYRDTKSILGEHPIFKTKQEVDAIHKLNGTDLIKRRNALVKSINSFKANIAKGDRPDLDEKRQESIAERQYLLDIVDARLEGLK